MRSPAWNRLSNQVVGNIGLTYVCYRLSQRGWNVMPTARNARGVDIVGYSESGKGHLTVQVKALSKRNPVPLGTGLASLISDFVVIVVGASSDSPTSFILTPGEVKQRVHVSTDGKHTHWLQPKGYDRDEFRNQWERLDPTE